MSDSTSPRSKGSPAQAWATNSQRSAGFRSSADWRICFTCCHRFGVIAEVISYKLRNDEQSSLVALCIARTTRLLWEVEAAQQVREARVISDWVEPGIHPGRGHSIRALAIRLVKPYKGLF